MRQFKEITRNLTNTSREKVNQKFVILRKLNFRLNFPLPQCGNTLGVKKSISLACIAISGLMHSQNRLPPC